MSLAIIKSIIILVFLLISTVLDIKNKNIPIILILICGAALLLLSILDQNMNWTVSLLGTLLGGILLLLSKILNGAIGMGDGCIILLVGFVMGLYGGCVVLFYSLFLAAIFSVILLCLKKCKKKDSIPFVPFVLISYLGVYLG